LGIVYEYLLITFADRSAKPGPRILIWMADRKLPPLPPSLPVMMLAALFISIDLIPITDLGDIASASFKIRLKLATLFDLPSSCYGLASPVYDMLLDFSI